MLPGSPKALDCRSALATMQVEAILNDGPNAATTSGISFVTARWWLARLGWVWGRDRKGYVDGYEREDVVEYREKVFLPCWLSIRPTLREWFGGEEIMKPRLPWGTPQRILITHDESTFNANDDAIHSWKKKGTQHLKKKGKGKGLMVSEFLSAACGRLSYFDHTTKKRIYATEILKYDAGSDGYWTSQKM